MHNTFIDPVEIFGRFPQRHENTWYKSCNFAGASHDQMLNGSLLVPVDTFQEAFSDTSEHVLWTIQ